MTIETQLQNSLSPDDEKVFRRHRQLLKKIGAKKGKPTLLELQTANRAAGEVLGIIEQEPEPRDFGSPYYNWEKKELDNWLIDETLVADPDAYIEKYMTFELRKINIFSDVNGDAYTNRFTKLPSGLNVLGSVWLDGCPINFIPAGIFIKGNLYLRNTKLKPQDISPDIQVKEFVCLDRGRDDLIKFFKDLKIRVSVF